MCVKLNFIDFSIRPKQNESLSKNLHQIINQNFSFSIRPDERSESIRVKKSSAADNRLNLLQTEDETRFKEFNHLFNGKCMQLNKDDSNKERKMDEPACEDACMMEDSATTKDNLISEYDELINNLNKLSPQFPEVLTYRLSNDASHICCADLRGDLKYCAAGCENSEVLVFLPDLEPNSELSSKWLSADQESCLIEEKQERGEKRSFSFYGHQESVVDLKFVPNSNLLLTCSNDTNSILWDLNEKETSHYLKKKYFGHTQPVYSLDVNCLGTHFATGSKDYTSRLFSLDRSNLLRSFIGHQNAINCVHFHPNSKYLGELYILIDFESVIKLVFSIDICSYRF